MKQLQRLPTSQPASRAPWSSSSRALVPERLGTGWEANQAEGASSRDSVQTEQPCLSLAGDLSMRGSLLQREAILRLHRTLGNQAVGRLLRAGQRRKQKQPLDRASGDQPGERESAPRARQTGLPDALQARVEQLSGLSLDDVRVHYHSAKPAQIQALAYTRGTQIYVAPGQEEHLAHETWHVVQQKQGRVQPDMQIKGVTMNADEGLEREADDMGARVSKPGQGWHSQQAHKSSPGGRNEPAAPRALSHLPGVVSGPANDLRVSSSAETQVIQRKPVYYHQKGQDVQNSYRDDRDKEFRHIFQEEGKDTYKLGSITLYYDPRYDQYTTDNGEYWDPVTGKFLTIDAEDEYKYYDENGNTYLYKGKNKVFFYVEASTQKGPEKEEKLPGKRKTEEPEGEEKQKKREKEEQQEKPEKKQKNINVDTAIAERFDIYKKGQVFYFYPKGKKIPASGHRGNEEEKATSIGMISWETKNDEISFDVSKFNPEDKTYPGIGYAMIYYLLKQNSDYPTVSIEVFQSRQDATSLVNWYKTIGFGTDFTADTSYIRDNCKRLYAEKG